MQYINVEGAGGRPFRLFRYSYLKTLSKHDVNRYAISPPQLGESFFVPDVMYSQSIL